MLAKTISVPALLLGVFLGSAAVAAICVSASMVAPLVALLKRVPLWCIVGAFAVFTGVEALTLPLAPQPGANATVGE